MPSSVFLVNQVRSINFYLSLVSVANNCCLQILPSFLLPHFASVPAQASQAGADVNFHLTAHPVGWFALVLFVLAYVVVVLEERIHVAKSKPVVLAAALIWGLIAWQTGGVGGTQDARHAFEAMFLEYAEIFFFLVVAMTYVTAVGERGVFDALRNQLTRRRFSYRSLFWITGVLAFFLSPMVDNLTTALVMSAG